MSWRRCVGLRNIPAACMRHGYGGLLSVFRRISEELQPQLSGGWAPWLGVKEPSVVWANKSFSLVGPLPLESLSSYQHANGVSGFCCITHRGSLQQSRSHSRQLRDWSTDKKIISNDVAGRLWKGLLGSTSWNECEKVLNEMERHIKQEHLRATMMRASRLHAWRLALWVFNWIALNKRLRFQPDAFDYSLILKILVGANQTSRVHAILSNMKSEGIQLNKHHRSSLLKALFLKDQIQDAENYVNELPSAEKADHFMWHGLIQGYGSARRAKEMFEALSRMKELGLCPNDKTYNILIGRLGDMGELAKMENAFEEMKAAGIPPNYITFVHMAGAYTQVNDLDNFEKVFKRMEEAGISWIMHAAYVRLSFYGKTGNTDKLDKAVAEILETDFIPPWIRSNVLTCAMKQFLRLNRWTDCLELMDKFRRKGSYPDHRCLCMLLAHIARLKGPADSEEVQECLKVLTVVDSEMGQNLTTLLDLRAWEETPFQYALHQWVTNMLKDNSRVRFIDHVKRMFLHIFHTVLNLGQKKVALGLFILAEERGLPLHYCFKFKTSYDLNIHSFPVPVARMALLRWLKLIDLKLQRGSTLGPVLRIIAGSRIPGLRDAILGDLAEIGLPFQVEPKNAGELEVLREDLEATMKGSRTLREKFAEYGLE